MRNIKLTIEYDGTNYAGWQIQPNGVSIQELVERAIFEITGEKCNVTGSGRTDAGVHALGQVANFKSETKISAADLVHALNTKLPEDVAIVAAADVPEDFHARYTAKRKTYRYSIVNRDVRSPLELRRRMQVRGKLDLDAMRAAGKLLMGEHDFAAFRSKPSDKSSVRTISFVGVYATDAWIDVYITANGFLYNMMRSIAGTLIEVGQGKRAPESITKLLESRDRAQAGPTAPPHGLCLVEVIYEE